MEQITRDLHLFADGQELAQGCRMLLHSQETLSLAPQLFSLEILDLSDSSAALLSAAKRIEVLSSGSILASGELIDALTRKETSWDPSSFIRACSSAATACIRSNTNKQFILVRNPPFIGGFCLTVRLEGDIL